LIEGGSYTVAQAEANDEATIKAWLATKINSLTGFDATGIIITSADISVTVTPATAGTVSEISGANGFFSFTVNVKRGAGTPDTASKDGAITATPYDTTPDTNAISTAKGLIEGGSYTVAQADANDEAEIKDWLVSEINSWPAFAATGVTVAASDILATVTSATAGSVSDTDGIHGSFSFTVTVRRGAGTSVTTVPIGGMIIATPYDTAPDNNAIATAKGLIEAGSFTVAQAEANDEATIKAWLATEINSLTGFDATGITITSADITVTVTSAVAGTTLVVSGTDGSFSFTVNVKKGAGTPAITTSINGVITATAYDPSGDNNAISTAIDLIEAGSFTVAQAEANDEATIKAWLATEINALTGFGATGITITSDDISETVTSATAGTVSAVSGIDGSFSFTVNVKKGAGTPIDTASLSGVITATAYDPSGDNNAISTAIDLIEAGSFTVEQAEANDEATIKAWLATEINALSGFGATEITITSADISATVTSATAGTVSAVSGSDGSFNFTVNVKKGAGTPIDTVSLSGVITATAYDPSGDNNAISTAVDLIGAGSFTVEQAVANDEATIKDWLATKINALTGFDATGITIMSADVMMIPVASKPVNAFIFVASHSLISASSFAIACATVYDPPSIKTFAVEIALLSGAVS
jgi:hypothetical protein